MATVYLYSNLNMHNASVYYGTVLQATATEITISNGVDETIYQGNFTYDAAGVHGTLNTIYSYTNGNVDFIAEGLNMDASVAYQDIQVLGNAQAFFQAALAGNDQFYHWGHRHSPDRRLWRIQQPDRKWTAIELQFDCWQRRTRWYRRAGYVLQHSDGELLGRIC